jgi:hypothetical protein
MRAELKQVTTAPQIDLDEAREFLKLIGAQHCTFQTFDDNPTVPSRNPPLRRFFMAASTSTQMNSLPSIVAELGCSSPSTRRINRVVKQRISSECGQQA